MPGSSELLWVPATRDSGPEACEVKSRWVCVNCLKPLVPLGRAVNIQHEAGAVSLLADMEACMSGGGEFPLCSPIFGDGARKQVSAPSWLTWTLQSRLLSFGWEADPKRSERGQ